MKRRLVDVLALGIVLRVFFMVSTCHFDLLSHYWYAHFLVYHHTLNVDTMGPMVFYWPMVWFHSLWLFLIRPLLHHGMDLWPTMSWFGPEGYRLANPHAWQQFVRYPDISWILFLFKLPYLLIEFAMIALVLKMIAHKEDKEKALYFLLFNPISLFVTYIFGTYDIVLAFFVVLSLFFIQKQRNNAAMFLAGLSAYTKVYSIFLFPVYLVALGKGWRERLRLAFISLWPMLLFGVLALLTGNLAKLSKFCFNAPHTDYLLSLVWPFQHITDRIYVFVFAYFLLLFYMILNFQKKNTSEELARYSLVFSLLFYALCFFHPQYFLLVIPLLALQLSYERRLLSFFWVLTAAFFVYTFLWGKDLFWRLFMPLNPSFFMSLSTPAEWINRIYPYDKFIGIFRSLFSAASFIMIYLLLKKRQ